MSFLHLVRLMGSYDQEKYLRISPNDCSPPSVHRPTGRLPPDVEALGRSTWTFLHTLSASYPPQASPTQQSEMRQFLGLFSRLYPCWTCAEDFQEWMRSPGNEPRVSSRGNLGGGCVRRTMRLIGRWERRCLSVRGGRKGGGWGGRMDAATRAQ